MLAAGQAQVLFDQQPDAGPVMLCEPNGTPRWNYLWRDNPAIYVPVQPLIPFRKPYLLTGKGHLTYLNYDKWDGTHWEFSSTWKARDYRGRLYLNAEEFALGTNLLKTTGPYILVEPSSRDRKNRNRCWPFPQWQDLVTRLLQFLEEPILQLDHAAADRLSGVGLVQNDNFRDACGVLAGARLFIGPEGGLAHAAAALGTPAVVLWGGCVSADVLGYPEHINLVYQHPKTPCGSLTPCAHCEEAWRALTPDQVLEAAILALGKTAVPLAAGVQ